MAHYNSRSGFTKVSKQISVIILFTLASITSAAIDIKLRSKMPAKFLNPPTFEDPEEKQPKGVPKFGTKRYTMTDFIELTQTLKTDIQKEWISVDQRISQLIDRVNVLEANHQNPTRDSNTMPLFSQISAVGIAIAGALLVLILVWAAHQTLKRFFWKQRSGFQKMQKPASSAYEKVAEAPKVLLCEA
ncbi:hypothetical protein DdX_11794 [Ditylenchus destructor]|uniref:Uncharacterized protein n=1 Tax=Ditylenchus destructor TaxID=166010 RepID=A0AAD4MXD3_9BILA|nr:hypothetical protein DdX_11794 [Ditylenchus destructor]